MPTEGWKDGMSFVKLRDCLGLLIIRSCIQSGRHAQIMDKDSWVKKCREIVVKAHRGRGRPRKIWDKTGIRRLYRLTWLRRK